MLFLKQSTAREVKVGPFVDDTYGKTAETGLTITSSEVFLAKGEGDWAAKNESTSLVHESQGWYRCLLDTTDTNALGELRLQILESGALPVWAEFTVLPANVFDSLISGSDALQVHTNEITANLITATVIADGAIDAGAIASGAITSAKFAAAAIDATAIADNAIDASSIATGAITAAKFAAGAIDAAAIATDAIDADALKADAVAEIADGVWDELKSGHTVADSFGDYLDDEVTSRATDANTLITVSTLAALLDSGTTQAGSAAGTIVLASSASSTDDYYNGATVVTVSGDGNHQARVITDYVGATRTATVDENWVTTPITTGYFVMPTKVPAAIATINADTDNIQTRLPAALVGGRMDSSIGAAAANTITASALAADAATEIATAVWALVLETGFDASKAIRIIAAAVAGKVTGGPGSPVFRNLADTQDQITGTADSSGNRSAATYGS